MLLWVLFPFSSIQVSHGLTNPLAVKNIIKIRLIFYTFRKSFPNLNVKTKSIVYSIIVLMMAINLIRTQGLAEFTGTHW